MDLEVVIPTRSSAERLRVTLACLTAERDLPFSVIVVDDHDDGHDPRIAQVLREAGRRLRLQVIRGPRRGRAAARNAGAAHSRGRWLAFLDDDVMAGPAFIRAHAAAAAAGRFVHGRTRELPASARLLARIGDASFDAIRQARAELEERAGPRDPRRRLVANALEQAVEAMATGLLPDVAPWLGFIGGNTSVERAAFLRAGGFDEGFGRDWGCEDLELGARLYQHGLRRHFAPDALGVHLSHARPGRWDQHDRNLARFAARHPTASVRALSSLLGPHGRPDDYVRAVTRSTELAEALR
jgi:GT2 family glycosyltransferase